jgi:hypothetical protein
MPTTVTSTHHCVPVLISIPPTTDAAEPEVREACITSVFIPVIEAALAEYVGKWQERPEGDNLAQSHDVELIKEELRPLVFEEVRQQVSCGDCGDCGDWVCEWVKLWRYGGPSGG